MSSSMPIVKQLSILSIIPQSIVIFIMAFIFYQFYPDNYLVITVIVYLFVSYSLRAAVLTDHRIGIRLYRQKQFDEAILRFNKSYAFFKRNSWVDKYRYITLLSSSRISYTEMAMLNEAFCLSQIGEKNKAIKRYREILVTFPKSEMAEAAIKMLDEL